MKRLRFLWWTYTVRGTDFRLRGGAKRFRVGEGVLLGSLGPGEPVRPHRRDRVRPDHVHTVDRNRESIPLGCEDDVCDSPRHWNRFLRLVDDSGEVGQLAPKSPLGVQLVRWDSASFAFKAWIGFRTSGSTRRSAARYRLAYSPRYSVPRIPVD